MSETASAWRQRAVSELMERFQSAQRFDLTFDDEPDLNLERDVQVALQFELTEREDYRTVGNSRLAGEPDLPPEIPYPLTEDGAAYTFLAQINLAELPFVPDDDFPTRGILYFFLGIDEPAYDIDHRVLFFDGDMAQLRRTAPPADALDLDAPGERDFAAYRISWQPRLYLPEPEGDDDLLDWLMDAYPEMYDELCDEAGGDTLGGAWQTWAGDSYLDAYLCRNGIADLLFYEHYSPEQLQSKINHAWENGNDVHATTMENTVLPLLEQYHAQRAQHQKAARDWRVLFSLSSHMNTANMCWWDAGYVEFFIDRQDLLAKRFDNTYAHIATS